MLLVFAQHAADEGDSLASLTVSEDYGVPFTFMGRYGRYALEAYDRGDEGLTDDIGYLVPFQLIDPVWGRQSYLFDRVLEVLATK